MDEWVASHELTISPVEYVKEAVPVGPQHHFPPAPVPIHVGENRDLRGIPVGGVVGRELEMPLQFSGICIESHDGAAIQVVSGTRVGIPVWSRVASAPINRIEVGVKGTRAPATGRAVLPGIAGP